MWLCGPAKVAAISARLACGMPGWTTSRADSPDASPTVPAEIAACNDGLQRAGTVGLASGESAREVASQLRRDFWPTLALEWATQLVESSSQSHLGRAAVKC